MQIIIGVHKRTVSFIECPNGALVTAIALDILPEGSRDYETAASNLSQSREWYILDSLQDCHDLIADDVPNEVKIAASYAMTRFSRPNSEGESS